MTNRQGLGRVRLETGIYERVRPDGTRAYYEIGYYDDKQKQRWKKVDGGIEDARELRQQLHNGTSFDRGLRADLVEVNQMSQTIPLDKRTFLHALQATKGDRQRVAWLRIAAFGLAMARHLDPKQQ